MTDLLIVGGLAIDRFADGVSAPGGSVLHAAQAAVAEGALPTSLTVAGDEPEARQGLAWLRQLGELVHQPASSTIAYRHGEADGRRELIYEAASRPVSPMAHGARGAVLLLAPVADELPPATASTFLDAEPRCAVLLLQGWLRRLQLGAPVRPLRLSDVAEAAWTTASRADAIVVSVEDLAEGSAEPRKHLRALRDHLGSHPLIIVTLGAEGYLLDDPVVGSAVMRAPKRVVHDAPTVGSGDIFGVSLAVHLAHGSSAIVATEAAAERVIDTLERR